MNYSFRLMSGRARFLAAKPHSSLARFITSAPTSLVEWNWLRIFPRFVGLMRVLLLFGAAVVAPTVGVSEAQSPKRDASSGNAINLLASNGA